MKKNINNERIKYEKEDYVLKIANSNNNKKINDIIVGVDEIKRAEYQKKYGKNYVPPKKFNHFKKILKAFFGPFNTLLLVIAIIELILFFVNGKEIIDLISLFLISLMILLSGFVDYWQDYKAYNSSIKLHKLVENEYLILPSQINDDINNIDITETQKKLSGINETEIVVGDILYLTAGDIMPCDCKIIWADDLFVDESTLTGESDLVPKNTTNNTNILIECQNILFSQTTIKSGTCLAIAINVGIDTYAQSIINTKIIKATKSNFEKGVSKITWILIAIICTLGPIVLLTNGFKDGDWIQSIIFSISVVVGVIPESLSAIISSNLQMGAKKLAKEKIVVKNFSVIQNLGSVNVLCTDKTGTLTIDEINLDSVVDCKKNENENIRDLLYINSYFQKNLTNKMDEAINKLISPQWQELLKYEFVDDIPFDFTKRISSVLVKKENIGLQITKGSIDEILSMASTININNSNVKFDEKQKQYVQEIIEYYASLGYRSIAIATKKTNTYIDHELNLEGFALFSEVLKPDAKSAIAKIYSDGIDLNVLTGDALEITKNIATKLELKQDSAILGRTLNEITDDNEYRKAIKENNLFVKLNPFDKAQIINTIKNDDTTVAFMGDGVNDAMVLKNADVGISVNNGTPIAKSAANIVLLEKDLLVVENSFIRGRIIFTNAIKYIKLTVASNFGLILIFSISTFWFDFKIMTPIQIIMQNLIFDFVNLFFVFDNVDRSSIKKPVRWRTKTLFLFAFWNGIILSLISVSNFLIMGYNLDTFNTTTFTINPDKLKQFQTSFFIECIFSHIVLILMLRSEKLSFIKTWPNKFLVLGLVVFSIISIILIFPLSLVDASGFTIPNHEYVLTLLGIIPSGAILQEASKHIYVSIFHEWL